MFWKAMGLNGFLLLEDLRSIPGSTSSIGHQASGGMLGMQQLPVELLVLLQGIAI